MAKGDLEKTNKRSDWLSAREPFSLFQRDMNRLFENFFDRDFLDAGNGFSPQVDLSETEKEIIVKADIPGVEEKDLDISISNNILVIRGEKKSEKEEKKENYYRSERSYGSFQRSIQLPVKVEESKVDAVFKNGVLKITLPKDKSVEKGKKQISVKKG